MLATIQPINDSFHFVNKGTWTLFRSLVQQGCSAMVTIVRTGVMSWTPEVMETVVKMRSLGGGVRVRSMSLPLPVLCP